MPEITILLILYTYFISTKQNQYRLEGHKMTKQFLVKTEWQLRQLSFAFLFLRLEEEFWCQLRLNGKIATLFYCADGFHFGKNCLILGNFDTTIGKICICRPLGMTGKQYLINKAKNQWYLSFVCKHLSFQFAWSKCTQFPEADSAISIFQFEIWHVPSYAA